MRWPEFRRAHDCVVDRKWLWVTRGLAVVAALLLPLLILVLGLIVEMIVAMTSVGVSQPAGDDLLLGPWVSGRIIPWPPLGDHQLGLLLLVSVGILLASLEVAALWWMNRGVQRLAIGVTGNLLERLHRQANRLGTSDLLGEFHTQPEQLLESRLPAIRLGLVAWWGAIPYAVVALVVLVALALLVNFWLALVVLLGLACIRQVYRGLVDRAMTRASGDQARAEDRMEQIRESFRQVPLVEGYGLRSAPGRPFHSLLTDYTTALFRAREADAGRGPTLLLLVLLLVIYTLTVVGLSQHTRVAGTVVLAVAMIAAYFPAARIRRLRDLLGESSRAAADYFEYLDRKPGLSESAQEIPLGSLNRSVVFERVTLADTNGRKLLAEFSCTIDARQRTALITSDRHVATSMAGLLLRLYDPAAGRVLFDDQDVATVTLASVRKQALLVPRDGMIFEGTINENIACGDHGRTALEITDAAKKARAHNFIMDLPGGFAMTIGNQHAKLKVGEAFRIGLARALLRKPSLLVIDEPDEGMDEASAEHLDEALRLASADHTLIILPGRLATLRSVDRVLLIHEGKLHADGTHADLLQSNQLYRHLNYVRFHAFRNIR